MAFRFERFDFFEGCPSMLARLRMDHRTVVLSNGPLYSQRPKVDRVKMELHVDRVVLAGDHALAKARPAYL